VDPGTKVRFSRLAEAKYRKSPDGQRQQHRV